MKETKKKPLKVSGTVLESLPSLDFKVRLDDNREIIGHLAGKLQLSELRFYPETGLP